MLFDGCDKVIGVFLFCVSYSEVVNDEGKTDVTGLVEIKNLKKRMKKSEKEFTVKLQLK